MLVRISVVVTLWLCFGFIPPAWAQAGSPLSLRDAVQRALSSNPRLTSADRDIGIATGRRVQAGAIPNPEVSFEADNVLGTGAYRGTRSAETTLQLGQLVELGGKRDARIAAGSAGVDAAFYQRAAVRLEVISDVAVSFFNVLGAQRRIAIFDVHVAALQRLIPLLQRRVDAGASSFAEVARAQVAADLIRADREKAKTALAIAKLELATLMGASRVDYSLAIGDFSRAGIVPSFSMIRRAVEGNPQLIKFTALRAQRDAELLVARLKAVPDLRAGVAWRHLNDTGDNAVRIGVSIPIPVFDQNRGGILEAQQQRAKVEAEASISRAALLLTLGRAYETLSGSAREADILHGSLLNARRAVESMENGYTQGRFSLLELLDVHSSAAQAALRELDALMSFYVSLATIEGLIGTPLHLSGGPR